MPYELKPPPDRLGGPSEAAWEAMKPHIHHKYIEEGRTLADMMQIMSTEHEFKASRKMYNTHFAKWGEDFDKNRKKGRSRIPVRPSNGKRTRPKTLRRPNSSPPSTSTTSSALLVLTPQIHRDTEVILISGGLYIDGLFRTVTGDPFRIAALNRPERPWKGISDQIWGASQLILDDRNNGSEKGMKALNRAYESLCQSRNFRNHDLEMMVRFWRMCHRMHKTDCRIRNSLKADCEIGIFANFLGCLRNTARHYYSTEYHPLLRLLDAIKRTPPDKRLDAFEVAYRQTIDAMESHLGQQHLAVLEMRSNHLKYWENESLAHSLIKSYSAKLDATENEFGHTGEPTIQVLHDFVYALYYAVKDRTLAAQVACDALERVKTITCFQKKPSWGMPAQTFAFTAKLLAMVSLDDGMLEGCQHHLKDAIITLERGDQQCRTRAVMLTGDLQKIYSDCGQQDQAADWELRKLDIARRLDEGGSTNDSSSLESRIGETTLLGLR